MQARNRHRKFGFLCLCAALLIAGPGCIETEWGDWSSLMGKNRNRDGAPDPETLPEAPPPAINADTHIASGVMLERQRDFNGAKSQYEKALAADPKSLDATNRLGKVCCKLRQFDEAAAAFRRALDIAPRSAAVRNNLGYNLMAQGNIAEAEQQFRAALAIDRDFERARVNLGVALVKQQRIADATSEFLKVLPRETAYYNVGIVCLEEGRPDQARRAFQQALAVKPDFAPAKRQLAKMGASRSTGRQTIAVRNDAP